MATTIKFKRGTSLNVNEYTQAEIGEPVLDYESGRLFISTGEGQHLIPVDQRVFLQGYEGFVEVSYGSSSGTTLDSGEPSADTDASPGELYINSDSNTPSLLLANPDDGDAVWGDVGITETTDSNPAQSDEWYPTGTIWVNEDTEQAFVKVGEESDGSIWVVFAGAGTGSNVITSTSDPSSTDDSYDVGTVWVNIDSDVYFVCTDNTSDSAIWVSSTSSPTGVVTFTDDPTASDDTYDVGTIWINTSTDNYFVCTDNSSGAAVWDSSSSSASGVNTSTSDPTASDDGYDVGTIWVNTDTDIHWVCTDNSASNAVWRKSGPASVILPDQSGNSGYYLRTDGSNVYWDSVSGSGGGSPYIDKRPNEMYFDDTTDGASRENAYGIFPTIDFAYDIDGAIWMSFELPPHFNSAANINLRLVYNLSGDDSDSDVIWQTEYWTVSSGQTPSTSNPNSTIQDTIGSGTTQGVKRKTELTNGVISSADLTDQDTVALRMTRLGSDGSDTYTGTFQLISVEAYQ